MTTVDMAHDTRTPSATSERDRAPWTGRSTDCATTIRCSRRRPPCLGWQKPVLIGLLVTTVGFAVWQPMATAIALIGIVHRGLRD